MKRKTGDQVKIKRDMAQIETETGKPFKARKGQIIGGYIGTDGDRITAIGDDGEYVIVDEGDVKVG